jgi:hypothetical protein
MPFRVLAAFIGMAGAAAAGGTLFMAWRHVQIVNFSRGSRLKPDDSRTECVPAGRKKPSPTFVSEGF